MKHVKNRRPRPIEGIDMVTLHGPITVAYRRVSRMWHCTALQFDLVGVGKTKVEAFAEMRDLLRDYLEEVLATDGPVRFFNPAESGEWNVRDQEYYNVALLVSGGESAAPNRTPLSDIARLRGYRDAVQGIGLVPAGA